MREIKRFSILLLILFLFISIDAYAQLVVTGKVTDERGEILPGANVLVVGTNMGAATDLDGNFRILIPSPAAETQVEATYIGYKKQRKTVTQTSGTAEVNFALAVDILESEAIVVTGTAEPVAKRNLGHTVETVRAKEIENSGVPLVDASLAGKVPGAMVQLNSGNPGGGTTVRLRGLSTLSGNADPLYIIDGIILDNSSDQLVDNGGYTTNRLADLDPNEIDRIEVVKGAAAAAIYGSRANNGVVQIFTKRGQPGKLKVSFSSTVGTDQIVKKLGVIDYPFQFTTGSQGQDSLMSVERYDYQDDIFRTAFTTNQNLSISGGDQTTRYYISGTNTYQEGIIDATSYNRQNIRLNLDRTVANWLNISSSTSYIHSKNNILPTAGVASYGMGVLMSWIQSRNTSSYYPDESGNYPKHNWNPAHRANPLEVIARWKSPEEVDRFIGGLKLDIIPPIKGLTLQYRFGYDTYTQSSKKFIPRESSQTRWPDGFSEDATKRSRLLNSDIDASLSINLTSKIKSTTSVGSNYQDAHINTLIASTQDLTPLVETVQGSAEFDAIYEYIDKRRTLGFYAQETFNFNDQFFLTGSIRADGSSTFGADERWQTFPKFSTSYLISEHPFWQRTFGSRVNRFKLRGAYGFSGGQPISSFGRLANYVTTTYDGKTALINSSVRGNENLKPERMREFEIGAEFEILNGRLGVELSYYDVEVSDLIISQKVAASTGFSTQLENVGILTNNGIELLLRSLNVNKPSFKWTTTLTFSTNNPLIEKLYGENAIQTLGWSQAVLTEGKPPSVFYTKIIEDYDDNGLPVRSADKFYVGDPNPDYFWSLTNEFDIGRNFAIRSQFDAVWGFEILDWNTRSQYVSLWPTHPDYEQEYKGELPRGYWAKYAGALGEFVTDASFIKCRELSLIYTLDADFVRNFGLSNIQLSLIGRNLFTITDYTGFDPEVNGAGQDPIYRGFDMGAVPIPRSINFGIKLNL